MDFDAANRRSCDFSRFMSKVAVLGENDCWNWLASKFEKRMGYGQFSFRGMPIQAQRAIWIMINGEIPDGMCVCHKCDNPPCVNPKHLFLGSREENNTDMRMKGRYYDRGTPGELNGMSKLTENSVREIRSLHSAGKTTHEIAKVFDVGQSTIFRVVSRRSWKHVD